MGTRCIRAIHAGITITIIVMVGTDMMIDAMIDGETIVGVTTPDVVTTDEGTTVTTTTLGRDWTEAAAETETLHLTRMVGRDVMTTVAAEIVDE
jgi:hypothetical protein